MLDFDYPFKKIVDYHMPIDARSNYLINQGFDHSSFHQAPTGVGFVVDGSPRL